MTCNCSSSSSGSMSQYVSMGNCDAPPLKIITNGLSAYQLAVLNGYTGTEVEWLATLSNGTPQTGSFVPYASAGTTGLPTTGTGVYSIYGGVVTWTMTASITSLSGASGNITIGGLPITNMTPGTYGVNVDQFIGVNTYASFVLTSSGLIGYKDNIGNVVTQGTALSELTYDDLQSPSLISLSGTYLITNGST